MKNQPEEIYLNLGDGLDCQDWNELAKGEIGWSTEPCTDYALRYVRADLQDREVQTVGLRDKFAMAALQGLIASWGAHDVTDFHEIATDSYNISNAMLKERLK